LLPLCFWWSCKRTAGLRARHDCFLPVELMTWRWCHRAREVPSEPLMRGPVTVRQDTTPSPPRAAGLHNVDARARHPRRGQHTPTSSHRGPRLRPPLTEPARRAATLGDQGRVKSPDREARQTARGGRARVTEGFEHFHHGQGWPWVNEAPLQRRTTSGTCAGWLRRILE